MSWDKHVWLHGLKWEKQVTLSSMMPFCNVYNLVWVIKVKLEMSCLTMIPDAFIRECWVILNKCFN